MAPHSSTLAWKIPWMEEPGRLQSMGSLRVRYDWGTSLSLFTFTCHFHALEKEMATHSSVLAWRIPGTGEPDGCCLWGRTESDMTEATAAAAVWLSTPMWELWLKTLDVQSTEPSPLDPGRISLCQGGTWYIVGWMVFPPKFMSSQNFEYNLLWKQGLYS